MNNQHTSQRGPSARCNRYAPLLPLLDEPDMNPKALGEARAHLATCAFCQQQRAAYRRLELAARRYLGPPASPYYQTEEIMRDLLGEPAAASSEGESKTLNPLPAGRAPGQPGSTRRFISGLASLAAVLVIVVVTVTLFANRTRPTAETRNGTPTPVTIPAPYSLLYDISMVSPIEGWAVGASGPCSAQTTPDGSGSGECHEADSLLMHYQKGQWSLVHLPFKVTLTTISMLSATDGWAGGVKLLLHYDGHTWQQVPNPDHLTPWHMYMLSDNDGWAIASIGDPALAVNETLVHYDGRTWTAQKLPASLGLSRQRIIEFGGLAMISPTEGWATGCVLGSSTAKDANWIAVILHYANGEWTVQWAAQSSAQGACVLSISMLSASEGWAAGYTQSDTSNSTQHPLLLHYWQGKWTRVTSSLDTTKNAALQISMVTATDGWLYGPESNAVFHYNGQRWVKVPLPAAQYDFFFITRLQMLSATEGWAIGFADAPTNQPSNDIPGTTALILHYHNGTWSVFPTRASQ